MYVQQQSQGYGRPTYQAPNNARTCSCYFPVVDTLATPRWVGALRHPAPITVTRIIPHNLTRFLVLRPTIGQVGSTTSY